MNTETIYAALRDYIDLALARLAETEGSCASPEAGSGEIAWPGVPGGRVTPDTTLKVEVAEGEFGEEWTGIRMSKLPASLVRKRFISGGGLLGMTFQMLSKQSAPNDAAHAVTYATCLEKLAGTLQGMFREGIRPVLPEGMELRGVEALRQSTLNYADTAYGGYVLDLHFTIKTRSF